MTATILTLDEISKQNKSSFISLKEYIYYNNGFKCLVYCYSDSDFLKLFMKWKEISWTMNNKYVYTFNAESSPISIEDVHSKNNHRIKMFLKCPYTKVNYIQ